jgi:4-hydroxybenzoate polyprenyltransferase
MLKRAVEFIFFGNYFIGILAIALSVESAVQLHLPLNSFTYYILVFSSTIIYYTYAYTDALNIGQSINPRTEWYRKNHNFVMGSQWFLLSVSAVFGVIFFYKNCKSILYLPLQYWLILLLILAAGILYYGLLPRAFYKINLRNTGWLKAFVIGFVWACSVNLLPFIALRMEKGFYAVDPLVLLWLFIKNWMFCTVNAIMFDIKDYADDSNRQLKTFVVRFGLRKTIFFVLLPLILVGLFSLIAVASARHLGLITILFNTVPFILMLMIAWSMQKPHKIIYYLVVIDGLIFLKALCGIAGMHFVK